MSDKRILDPLLIELAEQCCRLDGLSNDIHAALRNGRELDVDPAAVLDKVASAADLCARLIKDPASRRSGLDGHVRAVSFALRAAHEALDALISASHPPGSTQDKLSRPTGTSDA